MSVTVLHNQGRKFKTRLGFDVVILDTDFRINHRSYILFKLINPKTASQSIAICNDCGRAYDASGTYPRSELDLTLVLATHTMYTILKHKAPQDFLEFECAFYADITDTEKLISSHYPEGVIATITWEA